jgi:hypothetical protein
VRIAERNAVGDERLRRVGREQERIRRSCGEPAAVELEPVDEHEQSREREPHVAPRAERRLLVLGQVGVVGER